MATFWLYLPPAILLLFCLDLGIRTHRYGPPKLRKSIPARLARGAIWILSAYIVISAARESDHQSVPAIGLYIFAIAYFLGYCLDRCCDMAAWLGRR